MPSIQVPPGVEGIAGLTQLPDPSWAERWDRIILPAEQKDRLLNYVLFSLRHRGRVGGVGVPIHGLVVLAGDTYADAPEREWLEIFRRRTVAARK
mgnify:CR=1 FL=1